MKRLEGKNTIITGASRGIGKEIALGFAEAGSNLAICARSEEKLAQVAKACEAKGVRVFAQPCNISEEAQITDFTQKAGDFFGGHLDVLINNAVTIRNPTPFLEQDIEALDEVMKSGFYSTWHFMQKCFPLLENHDSSIINFSSQSGFLGNAGYAGYASTKEAIRALSRVAAREWGQYCIRVNTISPGAVTESVRNSMENDENLKEYLQKIFTDNPLKKMGDPYRDIMPVAVFLASADSGFITGQDLKVEGGATMYA